MAHYKKLIIKVKGRMGNNGFGAFITFSGKIINAIFGYITLVLLARMLSIEEFGTFSFFLSLIPFCSIIALAGMENVLLLLLPKRKKQGKKLYSNTIINALIIISVSSFLTIISLVFSQDIISSSFQVPDYKVYVKILFWVVPIQALIICFRALNQSEFHFIKAAVPENFVRPIVFFLLIFIFFTLQINSLYLVSISYLISFITTLIVVLLWRKDILTPKNLQGFKADKTVIKLSPQFLIIQLMSQAVNFLPIVIMGIFLTSVEIGIFKASQQTTLLVSFILISVNMIFAPTISSFYSTGNMKKLKSFYINTTKWTFFIGGYICVSIFMNANVIMGLFGGEYAHWGNILQILAVSQLVNASTGSSGYMLLMTGKQRIMIFLTLVQIIVILISSLNLVHSYNLYGIAFSVAIGVIILNILQILLVWRIHKVLPFTKNYIGVLFSILISLVVALIIERLISNLGLITNTLISVITITISYVCSFVLLGMKKSERNKLVRLIR